MRTCILLSVFVALFEASTVFADQLDEQMFRGPPPFYQEAFTEASKVIEAMAISGDARSLDRLHLIFETYPEWRHIVAVVIANYSQTERRRSQDWRLLVRSLAVVEGKDARIVMRALLRFHQRSTKPRWQRQVIVLGLQLGDEGSQDAISLLEHWTTHNLRKPNDPWKTAIEKWQAWFAKTYPDQPAAKLPQLSPETKWQYDPLCKFLSSREGWQGDVERGKLVFEKADCHKCHRFGDRGEPLGPDLTQISGRMQRKEILHAILFPSELVPDQYLTYSVITTDGRTFTGIVGRSGSNNVVILQANGLKVTIKTDEIDELVLSKQSAMPAGTLERLTKMEIADLFAYLRSRSD